MIVKHIFRHFFVFLKKKLSSCKAKGRHMTALVILLNIALIGNVIEQQQ